jgi:hypothetical protein
MFAAFLFMLFLNELYFGGLGINLAALCPLLVKLLFLVINN